MKKRRIIANTDVCAVIVTKNPDSGFQSRIGDIRRQVGKIILVDNGTSGLHRNYLQYGPDVENVLLIENKRNLGVAAALNTGIAKAVEAGFDWVLTLDQDSEPDTLMVELLLKGFETHQAKEQIAILAPKIVDIGLEREALFLRSKSKFLYERHRCCEGTIVDVTNVITSGALICMKAYKDIGKFRSDFFIDYVDTEFCLRAHKKGYLIVAVCDAKLNHRFGERQSVRFGPLTLFPSFHRPERWYTISRNRIPMIKSYGLKYPHWLIYEAVATIYILLRMLFTEDQRWDKLKAIAKGTMDGIFGRMGLPYWVETKYPPTSENAGK
jgi:rhamnosyltransferase